MELGHGSQIKSICKHIFQDFLIHLMTVSAGSHPDDDIFWKKKNKKKFRCGCCTVISCEVPVILGWLFYGKPYLPKFELIDRYAQC